MIHLKAFFLPEFDKRVIMREVMLDPFKDTSKFFGILTICDFFIKIFERYHLLLKLVLKFLLCAWSPFTKRKCVQNSGVA